MKQINLEVKNLTKKYDNYTAVNSLSFRIKEGEIYALLGPNGAGKTSTFESIEGIIRKTSGNVLINGREINLKKGLEKDIGVQLQDSAFQNSMKVKEITKLVSMYYGCGQNHNIYEKLEISKLSDKKISDLSVGQRRRVSLYLAFMHNPKVIILDEPTAGVDVITKNQIYDILMELKSKGTSILISSHDMAEIEKLADTIGVIVNGNLIREASALEMTSTNNDTKKIILKTEKGSEYYKEKLRSYATSIEELKGNYLAIYTVSLQPAMFSLMNEIDKNKDVIIDLRVEQPSLEETFMKITSVS